MGRWAKEGVALHQLLRPYRQRHCINVERLSTHTTQHTTDSWAWVPCPHHSQQQHVTTLTGRRVSCGHEGLEGRQVLPRTTENCAGSSEWVLRSAPTTYEVPRQPPRTHSQQNSTQHPSYQPHPSHQPHTWELNLDVRGKIQPLRYWLCRSQRQPTVENAALVTTAHQQGQNKQHTYTHTHSAKASLYSDTPCPTNDTQPCVQPHCPTHTSRQSTHTSSHSIRRALTHRSRHTGTDSAPSSPGQLRAGVASRQSR